MMVSPGPGPRRDPPEVLRRDLLAFTVTPFVAVAAWLVLTFGVLARADGLAAALADVPALAVGAATFGVFLATAATVVVAGPLYALAAALDRVSAGAALAGGPLTGLIVALAWAHVTGAPDGLPPWMGAAVGLLSAVAWVAASGRTPGRPLPSTRTRDTFEG